MDRVEAAIAHYRREHMNHLRQLLAWYAAQPSLADAIFHAAHAHDQREKRHPHQRRLKGEAIRQACEALLARSNNLSSALDFEDILVQIEEVVACVSGLGELYAYDTALRIGAYQAIYPREVYIHAGTRVGVKALGIDPDRRSIRLLELPDSFQKLMPHEAEDVLCIYKSVFENEREQMPEAACVAQPASLQSSQDTNGTKQA